MQILTYFADGRRNQDQGREEETKFRGERSSLKSYEACKKKCPGEYLTGC